jgi:hypothetical protein
MGEYISVIVDECGSIRAYCSDYSDDDIMNILYQHPEWSQRYISI